MKSTKDFIKYESNGAKLLLIAGMLALVLSNSPWEIYYSSIFREAIVISFFNSTLNINILSIINECLMTIFFLVVGLEIKYELLFGSLNSTSKAILPAMGAMGGIIMPAIIYYVFNYHNKLHLEGWAIPIATDIAIALGVITMLGSKVHSSLKAFLMALAILDDLAAIIVIALFYTENLSLMYFILACSCILSLVGLNLWPVKRLLPFIAVGFCLWFCLFKMGVHPTLAGVILAISLPVQLPGVSRKDCLSQRLKHALHPWVIFVILPIFTFANVGINVIDIQMASLQWSIILGICAGLFLGKQVGIIGFCWLSVKLGIAHLHKDVHWLELYGVAIICGIGFTISLFIGGLAFSEVQGYLDSVKIGVFAGSLLSALVGYIILSRVK
ncbi:MAG: Na+/H+ antiporter NhaA [Pseudomonadota bacterium]|nr:Na+/H+ antiporter NhaA [Pseudomonadota bacterium]